MFWYSLIKDYTTHFSVCITGKSYQSYTHLTLIKVYTHCAGKSFKAIHTLKCSGKSYQRLYHTFKCSGKSYQRLYTHLNVLVSHIKAIHTFKCSGIVISKLYTHI